jgi:hypothetical protein
VGTLPHSRAFTRNNGPITVGVGLIRRMFRLHGNALDNAARSVEADDKARRARHSAAEALARLVNSSP